MNGKLFFAADDGFTTGLFQSDGTAAGTSLVKAIDPRSPVNVNGTLFFAADDGTHGRELWKSDGTTGGTVLVDDVNPAAGVGSISSPSFLANVAGTLVFSANDGASGRELWKSDGTTAGTTLLQDINPGSASASPQDFFYVNGTLFFRAADVTHGFELWKSDGTTAGSTLVQDINPGTADSYPVILGSAKSTLFLRANDGVHGNEVLTNSLANSLAAVGQSDGSVQIFDPNTNQVLIPDFRPLDGATEYKSLVAVALGDVNGDSVPDLFVAAQKRAGIAGLDASKAGKVFVYSGAALAAGTADPANPLDTFTPFATNFAGTQTYETGFELATGDVNGDGILDLIASSRGDVGQIVVQSTASNHAQIGAVPGAPNGAVTPFGTTYLGKVEVASGNFIDEASAALRNDEIAAARGNTDALGASQTGTSTRLALFDLVGAKLTQVSLSGAFAADGTPADIQGTSGQVIDRNAFVAGVDANGTGVDSLVFAARDFVSDPTNPQIVIGLYSFGVNGFATLQSKDASGQTGPYRAGSKVGSYAISPAEANGIVSLGLIADGANAGILYLNPSDGTTLSSFTSLTILSGGVRLAAG